MVAVQACADVHGAWTSLQHRLAGHPGRWVDNHAALRPMQPRVGVEVMPGLIGFSAGLLLGAAIGVLAGAALGRHDDATLPWWLGVGV